MKLDIWHEYGGTEIEDTMCPDCGKDLQDVLVFDLRDMLLWGYCPICEKQQNLYDFSDTGD